MIGQPNGSEERLKARAQIAEADEADPRAVEREAPFRAVEQPFLLDPTHCAVRRGHAAAKVDRHPERHLGHRPREGGARRQHMDPALKEAGADVLQEIGLDVDDGAEFRARSSRDFGMSLWPINSAISGR